MMSRISSHARGVAQTARDILRAHVRSILPMAAVVVAGIVVLAFLVVVYAQIIGVTAYQGLVASIDSINSWTGAVMVIMIPVVLLAVLASLVWAGTVTQAASAAVDKKQTWMPAAAWAALRRAPKALAVVLVTLAAVLGAIVAAPVFLVVGLVGLIAKRSRREFMIPMAIPFGVAVLVLVRWSLALAAVWLDGLGVRAAYAESSRRVKGRGPSVAAILIVALLVNLGVVGAASLIPDPIVQTIVQLVALILVGALPFVALAVLYRRGSDARPAAAPAPLSRQARVAVAVVISLIVPLMVGVSPGSAVSGASATSGSAVTLFQYYSETLTGQDFILEADVTGSSPTGVVDFQAVPTTGPAIDLGSYPLDGLGRAVQDFGATFAAGDYQLIGYYSGDAGNAPATSDPLAHTVSVPTANIGVTSVAASSGDAATLTITLTPKSPATDTPTGTVTVSGGSFNSGPLTLNGTGVVTELVDVAAAGVREFTVAYSGNSEFGSASTLYTVPGIATTVNVFGATVLSTTYGDTQTFAGSIVAANGSKPTGTVVLGWLGAAAGTSTLVNGNFSFTTDDLKAGSGTLFVVYNGDTGYAPSDSVAAPIHLSISKAHTAEAITVTPSTPTIGEADTLTATLDDTGAGPGGTVDFRTTTGDFIGSVRLVNHVASITWIPQGITTFITATYSGDNNFVGNTSAAQRFDANLAPVTVTVDDPGPVTFGQLFTLKAHVKIGDASLRSVHGIDFVTSTGSVLASNVYVDATGLATLDFCARTICPAGDYVKLGASDLDIIASYPESNTNLLGRSAPYAYRPGSAGTTTTLVVNPTTVLFGSGVNLTATVATTSPGTTPTGSVAFYGVEPAAGGGTTLDLLGSSTLVGGVATLSTSFDGGLNHLRWPANQVTAQYTPLGAPFTTSSATPVPITLLRVATTISLRAISPQINLPTEIEATLSHDPGPSADYEQKVTFTSDTGDVCETFVHTGQHIVDCFFTWTTAATHSVTAVYSGDHLYLPSPVASLDVPISTATHATGLRIDAPSSALVGQDVVVTWHLTDPSETGLVTVWGDGVQWCQVAVTVQTCTGQFGNASATGGFVDIRVRYDGDGTWLGTEEVTPVTVTRCAILDVRSNGSSLGSVRVNTSPNCGASGYLPGTTVSVTATALTGAEFAWWLGYLPPAPNLVTVSTSATTTFMVTNDTQTWVHVAQFRTPCSVIAASPTGYGDIGFFPASNCTTDDGAAGYLYGTKVTIFPVEHYDPVYDEKDAFRSFGTLPPGATLTHDTSNRLEVSLTVTEPATIPLTFGPQCRPVLVVLNPSHDGDETTAATPVNCFSPYGDGYLRGTTVTAHGKSGDTTLAIAGWLLNGVAAPQLGITNDPVVTVDQVIPVLTATMVHCYAVKVDIDGVTDSNGMATALVRVDGTKCPDGSDRYLGGTQVTLTPQILEKGTKFNGWDDVRNAPEGPDSGDIGDVTGSARTLTADHDIQVTAGFYDQSACSTLMDAGTPGLLSFEFSGCGPGYYLDSRKQEAAREKVTIDQVTGVKNYGTIIADVHKNGPLGVYVSVHGDAPTCTGNASADSEGFKTIGRVTGGTSISCRASGPIQFWADQCQPVVTTPTFTVKGKPGTYGADAMPSTFYVTQGGVVSESPNYVWGQALPVTVKVKPDGSNEYHVRQSATGPCAAAPNLFAPNTDVLLYASAPASGFSFDGWTGLGYTTPFKGSPLHRVTNDTDTALTTGASFTVTCDTVNFDKGIHVIGDAPRCPGTSEADNSFIAGTSIKVEADYQIGNSTVQKFTSGVAGDQIYQDPLTNDLIGYAYVDVGTKVAALYQTPGEITKTTILEGLKFAAGTIAVMGPIFLSMVFPPAGILFGALGALAGISGAIPGGDKVAAVFDLLNPTKISACIARWGFNNTGQPSTQNVGSILGTANKVRVAVFTDTDVLEQNITAGGAALGAANLGYSLYSAGIGGTNFTGPQSVDDIAGRSTITGCLDQQWRAAGSDLSGNNDSSGKAP